MAEEKYDQDFFLALAAKGKEAWNAWRREPTNKDVHVTFAGIDFSEAPRDEIDFSGFEFGDLANFSYCKWHGVIKDEIFILVAFTPGIATFTKANFGDEANFTNGDFGDYASFTGANFGDGTIFIDAVFGFGASFAGVVCGGGANFSRTTFGNSANFNRAAFGDGSGFARANEPAPVTFTQAIFGSNANFTGAAFGDEASFPNTQFGANADFAGAKFGGWANFTHTKFGRSADFSHTNFGQVANFIDAAFGAEANFVGAGFSNSATFERTAFDNLANFEDAVFGDNATFDGASFANGARFEGVAFGWETSFAGTNFKGDVEFTGKSENQSGRDIEARARGVGEEARAALKKRHEAPWTGSDFGPDRFLTISFANARFGGEAVFFRRIFDADANFTDARFYYPPDFDAVTYASRMDLTGALIGFSSPGDLLPWTEDSRIPVRLRAFRKIVEETKNHDLERDLYIEERNAERGVHLRQRWNDLKKEGWRKWPRNFLRLAIHGFWISIMFLYWALADYGRNFVVPAVWLILSVPFFYSRFTQVLAPIMHEAGPANAEKYNHAIWALAFGNAVPFVGPLTIDSEIKKFLFCPGFGHCLPIPPEGFQGWVVAQNVVSIILVFFIGLALRNYFKIK
jgi:hypothetical protein